MQLPAVRLGIALQRRRRVIVVAVAIAMGLIVTLFGLVDGLERTMRDTRDAIRMHAASGDIHIVEIDARSLQRIDRWPWPRGRHAQAVDALRIAGAKSIAFDVDFSTFSTPVEDAKLARALARANGLVALPTFRQTANSRTGEMIENLPIKMLRDSAFLSAVTIRPDHSGMVREAPLGIVTAGHPRPSLAALVAETNAVANQYFAIDYSIDPSTIPRHSFIDLIEGRVPADQLRGKRIIIGATAVEMGDRYAVPLRGVIPGVVIQALAAETLLQGPVPRQFGPVLPLIVAIAGVLILALMRRGLVRNLLLAATALLLLVGPLLAEASVAIGLHTAPSLVMLAAAMMVSLGFRLLRSFLDRMLSNNESAMPNLFALRLSLADVDDTCVAVAHIDNVSQIRADLGPQQSAELLRRVAERLALSSAGHAIHLTDESALAWQVDVLDRDSGDLFDAIAAVMRAPVQVGGRSVDVSLHFGLARGPGRMADQLAAGALLAATRAAAAGVRWETFVADAEEETNWRLSLLGELDRAIISGDVWVAYQPKFDIAARRIMGAEALVRWTHPTRGLIRPDHFIPIAEESGRIETLTEHVLRCALRDIGTAAQPVSIAVNIAANLLADASLVDMVRRALEDHAFPADRLTLEVTESAAMISPDRAIATLDALAALGVKLSVDDYGTGQSTLTYLKRLPASELKIDKSFVQTIATSRSDAILVSSTINLAHELGLRVVAEGVEDAECLEKLGQMGCDIAQGYLIGKPMPFAAFAALLVDDHRKAA